MLCAISRRADKEWCHSAIQKINFDNKSINLKRNIRFLSLCSHRVCKCISEHQSVAYFAIRLECISRYMEDAY